MAAANITASHVINFRQSNETNNSTVIVNNSSILPIILTPEIGVDSDAAEPAALDLASYTVLFMVFGYMIAVLCLALGCQYFRRRRQQKNLTLHNRNEINRQNGWLRGGDDDLPLTVLLMRQQMLERPVGAAWDSGRSRTEAGIHHLSDITPGVRVVVEEPPPPLYNRDLPQSHLKLDECPPPAY